MKVLVEFECPNGHLRLVKYDKPRIRKGEPQPVGYYMNTGHEFDAPIYHAIQMSKNGLVWGTCAEYGKRVTKGHIYDFRQMARRLAIDGIKIK